MPGGLEFLEQVLGQRLARLVVLREAHERGEVVAPVLHELRRQLDRVPLHATDARHQALLHRRQHVLQRVAELVEERLHLAEGHQRGLVTDGRRLIADHVRARQAHALPLRRPLQRTPRVTAQRSSCHVRADLTPGQGRST